MAVRNKPIVGEQQIRLAQIDFRAVDGNENQVELSFSSEFPVERWFGSEVLLHDDNAVDFKRLLTVGTVLFTHGRDNNYGKMPVAKIDKAWLDAAQKKGRALITFDEDEDSQKVKKKILGGFIKGVSFGYSVNAWEEVKAGKTSSNGLFTGPAWLALRWEPYEISIEPTPADPNVGVGRNIEDHPGNSPQKEKNKRSEGNFISMDIFERQLLINKNKL